MSPSAPSSVSVLNRNETLSSTPKQGTKTPIWPTAPCSAVTNRIAALMVNLPQANRWQRWVLRFSKKFKQNLAELEALLQYSSSPVVWDIAYLNRKKAQQKLTALEQQELDNLMIFHDSPAARRITTLKLQEHAHTLSMDERRELTQLQRNLYQGQAIPAQVLDLLWPQTPPNLTDSFI